MIPAKYANLDRDELIRRCIQMEAVIAFLRAEADDKRVNELVQAALNVMVVHEVIPALKT